MAKKHMVSARMSRDVVRMLVDRGMSLTDIARTLKVSKSFISRVNAGTRGMTLEHFVALEKAVAEPLPWLLLKSTPLSSIPPELRPLYRMTLKLLEQTTKRKPRRKRAA